VGSLKKPSEPSRFRGLFVSSHLVATATPVEQRDRAVTIALNLGFGALVTRMGMGLES